MNKLILKYFCVIVIISGISFSCMVNKQLKFELYRDDIHPRLNENIKNGESNKNRSLIYIVHNYQFNKETEKAIDDFACLQYASMPDSIYLLYVDFYKYSKITNKAYLKEHPNQFYEDPLFSNEGSSLSRDYLWAYEFIVNKGCISKYKVKNYENLIFNYKEPSCGKIKN